MSGDEAAHGGEASAAAGAAGGGERFVVDKAPKAAGAAGPGATAVRRGPTRATRAAVAAAAVTLAVLHQDVWFWSDRTLVLGFFPIGLLYHGAFSIAAATFWFIAMRLVWPRTVMDAVTGDGAAPAAGGPRP